MMSMLRRLWICSVVTDSETETESESADFFTDPSETVRLRDFENRNNTTCYPGCGNALPMLLLIICSSVISKLTYVGMCRLHCVQRTLVTIICYGCILVDVAFTVGCAMKALANCHRTLGLPLRSTSP